MSTPGVVIKMEELVGSISDLALGEVLAGATKVVQSESSVPSSHNLIIDLGEAVAAGLTMATMKKSAKKQKPGATPAHTLDMPRPLGIGSPASAEDQQLAEALELIRWRGFKI